LLDRLGATPGRKAINLHLAFNLALAIVALPFVGILTNALTRMMPDKPADDASLLAATALDPTALRDTDERTDANDAGQARG